MVQDNKLVLKSIISNYSDMNTAEKRVADTIRSAPELIRDTTVFELSERAGVSGATIVRFCRSIGYKGYTDFKLALAAELGTPSSALPYEHADVDKEDSLESIAEKVMAINSDILTQTLRQLELPALEEAVSLITSAANVLVLGVGTSLPVVMDLAYRLRRSGVRTSMASDGHLQAVEAALIGPEDVAFAVSYSGEARDVIDAVELAKEAGAKVICLTGSHGSTLARICDISLVTPPTKPSIILDDESVSARLAQHALLDIICVAVALRNQDSAIIMKNKVSTAVMKMRSSNKRSK